MFPGEENRIFRTNESIALDFAGRLGYPRRMKDGRRWHDMGGLPAGPVAREEHDYALWEKRVDALLVLAQTKGLFTVDGLRRAIEDMGVQAFESMSYYERWIAAINQNLVESGVYSLEELGRRMESVASRGDTYGEASKDG